MLRKALIALGLLAVVVSGGASADPAPTEIKIGHMHASSGPFASISMPALYGAAALGQRDQCRRRRHGQIARQEAAAEAHLL